jgi:hypothetical protein
MIDLLGNGKIVIYEGELEAMRGLRPLHGSLVLCLPSPFVERQGWTHVMINGHTLLRRLIELGLVTRTADVGGMPKLLVADFASDQARTLLRMLTAD